MKLTNVISADGMKEWRAHWPVVLASMAGYAVSVLHVYSLGVMIEPLEQEFGWSRAQISTGHLIVSMFMFPLAPFMGMAIDRFGPRRVAVAGVAFYCGAVAALSFAQSALWTWYALWLLVAFGALCLMNTVWASAVTSLFDASRGMALAVTFCGSGIMTFIAPIATNSLVENFGWRIAYATLGAVAAVVVVPVVYLFFSSAKDAKRKAAGNVGLGRHSSSGRGMSLAEGLKSPPYVKLAVAALVLAGISVALLVNLVPILTSLGRDRGEAAAIAGMVGLTAIAGRLSGGYLLDHFNARVVGAIAALVLATSCLLLLNFGATTAGAITAVLIAGLAVGAEIDVVAYLTSRIVGAKSFGGLFGIIEGMLMFGAGIGPVVSNAVYDATRSYDAVLWAIMPLGMLVAFLLFTLGRYPDFVTSADAAS